MTHHINPQDITEVIGAIEYLRHQYPESEEVLLRAELAIRELGISKSLTLKEWAEKTATLNERRAQDLFEKLNPGATDDEYPPDGG